MKKLLLLILIIFSLKITSQTKSIENFKKEWSKVERLELDDLPKSALSEVENIYTKAKFSKNKPQIIKCLLYKSKFALTLKEGAELEVVNTLKKEIATNGFPVKNILQSILADLYWQYYQNNRYRFYSRSKTDKKIDSIDFRTCDLETLFEETHKYYQLSLSNSTLLKRTKLKSYDAILITFINSKLYRPTLYDFIAQRAISFYETDDRNLKHPSYMFEITNPDLLGDNTLFLKTILDTRDSLSQQLNALYLFKDLTKFHLKDKTPNALIALTLQRFDFVKENAIFKKKDSLYLKALNKLKNKYNGNKVSTEISYKTASILYNLSEKYNAKTNKRNRWKKKEALEICNLAIANYPQSKGAAKCKILKNLILNKRLTIDAEKFIPVNTFSRLLVTYKNVEQLYFNAFKVSQKELETYKTLYNDSLKIDFTKHLKKIKTWSSKLHNENDYQQHATEILLPKLQKGSYIVFVSPKKDFTFKNIIAYKLLHVTNLALIELNKDNYQNYQIVNRNNGAPVVGAKVVLKNNSSGKKLKKVFRTDKNGQITYKNRKSYSGVKALVSYKKDTASFGSFNYYDNRKRKKYDDEDDENIEIRPFVFTDRSIYRPGQTVYFKAIVVKTIGKKTEVVKDEYVEVTLEDPDGNDVKILDLKLNKFGSTSGKFVLPAGGITGEYDIYIDESYEHDSKLYDNDNAYFNDTETTFSVEEYKRPTFETKFSPVKQTFRLNDSITIKGNAKAFAGSNISQAKVVYRVVRKAHFPSYYYRSTNSYQYSNKLEIVHDETITDAQGNYKITFKAIPDLKIKKEDLPIFSYKITAVVTDINGETRNAETTVQVGYHSLDVSLDIPEKINQNKLDNKIIISTKNLNGESVTAKGKIEIYKLSVPKNVLRKRPWGAPDYQMFSKEEFSQYFPHDAYDNENFEKNRTKSKMVFSKDFDTQKSTDLKLENIRNWQIGKYIIYLTSKDKFGQDVKAQKYFTVYNPNNKHVADNKLFFINADKSLYLPKDTVYLKIGSASKDITITLNIVKKDKEIKQRLIHLNNESRVLKIPVTDNDRGGFYINYYFVNYNAFKKGSLKIQVPNATKDLKIEILSFRDKLQPGSKETWQFKITGDKGHVVTAELLASMYDASLDQFKEHGWTFPPTNYHYFYNSNNARAYYSFGTSFFNSVLKFNSYYRVNSKNYDRLNWFGFGFSNAHTKNYYYLDNLKRSHSSYEVSNNKDKKKGYVYGVVTDESGPLPGVSVTIVNTTKGTETDFDGYYAIKAKPGDVLQFSFVGMETLEVTVGKYNTINTLLNSSNNLLEEVVVTAQGVKMSKKSLGYSVSNITNGRYDGDAARILSGKVAGVQITSQSGATGSATNIIIRGYSSLSSSKQALFVIDGVPFKSNGNGKDNFLNLNPNDIKSINVLKGLAATTLYGAAGKNGVVIITTKSGQKKLDETFAKIKARKNFNETAFFFPQLVTDTKGNVSFNFTVPESLTRWKLMLLAHTKNWIIGTKLLTAITQKDLMVMPNLPRFLREGDSITFVSKIVNLTTKKIAGISQLQLFDALTNKPIDVKLDNINKQKSFSINPKGNTSVSWQLYIPKGVQAVKYKILAKSGDFTDGEENVLPILSNRMLVTESLPMWVHSNQTKTFTLKNLKNNTSTSLTNHKLTLEVTSNPAWNAVQALPYLMEFPYECSEQTFSRYYANALASQIATSNPKIEEVFNKWKNSEALVSNLSKNKELKSIIIQETPWLRDAQSETEQKKRIGLLFDLSQMKSKLKSTARKLRQMQLNNGGFTWFKGGKYPNRFITQHIVSGFGHLKKLNVKIADKGTKNMLTKAVNYLDEKILEDYIQLLKRAKNIRLDEKDLKIGLKNGQEFLAENHTGHFQIQYLYMRSFYKNIKINKEVEKAISYYTNQASEFWLEHNLYDKGMIALIANRNGDKVLADKIIASLKENAIVNDELGMYWKENTFSWYWYQAPIETQSLLIEAFNEIEGDTKTIDALKIWLLKNKQTKNWKTTKETTEAVYALLLQGSNWLNVTDFVNISIGDKNINPLQLKDTQIEAGTGYFKTSWKPSEIKPKMAKVTLSKKSDGIAWGALYWQYFEDLDKIKSAETPLNIKKKLFLVNNTDKGEVLSEITDKTSLKLGDLVRVRIELRVDRAMEFIHMKDMRASGFEPVNVLSEYKWQDGLGYYESTRDASTNFFFDDLPKGVYVFEYNLRVNNKGNFSNGVTTIQSMYAPEFSSHSKGLRVKIN